MFDRKVLRFYRKDGYAWRKKADGRSIREAHEKLKVRVFPLYVKDCWLRADAILSVQVENREVLNCYYAQSQEADSLQVWPTDQNKLQAH